METRDQELSFGTKIYGIFFIIDEDISSQKNEKKREVLWRSLYMLDYVIFVTVAVQIPPFPFLEFDFWKLGSCDIINAFQFIMIT